MATIFQRKGRKCWYINYVINTEYGPRKILKALNTTDRILAKQKKREIETAIEKGLHVEYRNMTVEDLFLSYKADKRFRKKLTNDNEFYTLDAFVESVAKKYLRAITENDARAFLKKYELKANVTFKNILGVIKRFFKFAVDRELLYRNPAARIKAKKIEKCAPKFFGDDDYLKIEGAAEGHALFPMIVTARYTGLRLGELIHLEWEDFDWGLKQIHVKNKSKFNFSIKNSQERTVPFCEQYHDKMLPYIKEEGLCFPVCAGRTKGGLYTAQGPKKALKGIFKGAGIQNSRRLGWHWFRKTFASRLVENGISLKKVSNWLGHSSVLVTEIYAGLAPQYDADIEKLNIPKRKKDKKDKNSANAKTKTKMRETKGNSLLETNRYPKSLSIDDLGANNKNSDRRNYRSLFEIEKGGRRELNPRPQDPQSCALTN